MRFSPSRFALALLLSASVAFPAPFFVGLNYTAPSGGGDWTLVAEDDFSWAPGTTSIGTDADWTVATGAIAVTNGGFHVFPNASGAGSVAYYDSAGTSLDTRVEFVVKSPSLTNYVGAVARYQTGSGQAYSFMTDGDRVLLDIAGVANIEDYTGAAITAGTKMLLEVTGAGAATRVSVYRDVGGTWVPLSGMSERSHATTLPAGYAGITGYNQSSSAQLDDWKWYSR